MPSRLLSLTASLALLPLAVSAEAPRLEAKFGAPDFTFQTQKQQVDLPAPYHTTSPEDFGDGIAVGSLEADGAEEAIATFLEKDATGEFENLDSLLLWKDGKLVFEFYNRKGRINAPHYSMSITKTMTSVVLGRAMQLGLMTMEDLDKPIIDLLPNIDPSTVAKGVETITLRESLLMESGLRWKEKNTTLQIANAHKGDPEGYFQALLDASLPVTAESKAYKYVGTDPSTVMAIIQGKLDEPVQDFIQRELVEKLGTVTCWEDQTCGLPKCGAGSNWSTRSLLKVAMMVLDGGKWKDEQILHPDYAALLLSEKEEEGYYYFFHNRTKRSAGKSLKFISGIGAGGQYMAMFPEENIILAAHSTNKGKLNGPLDAALGYLIPVLLED